MNTLIGTLSSAFDPHIHCAWVAVVAVHWSTGQSGVRAVSGALLCGASDLVLGAWIVVVAACLRDTNVFSTVGLTFLGFSENTIAATRRTVCIGAVITRRWATAVA
jgi:hypothetical protein